uniref:Lipoprotein n=1 Tax=Mycoplasma feriruminatoris TaxID=1179777 RepID=A0A654IK21_9MOLU|nr:hypothetical protein MF5295_00523 [Mycoplasma feriruminatoris]
MKKLLTILGTISLIIITSVATVACGDKFKNQIKKENKNKNLNKNPIDNLKLNDTTKSDNIDNKNLQSEKSQSDQPPRNDLFSKKQKEELTDKFASKLKQQIEEMINRKQDAEIIIFSKDINFKIINSTFDNELSKKISKLINELAKLFDSLDDENLKIQINVFLSNNFNENHNFNKEEKQKLSNLLTNTTRSNKDKILGEVEDLFSEIFTNELRQKSNEMIENLQKLLSKKDYESVKKELFILIEKISKLEKNNIENSLSLIN